MPRDPRTHKDCQQSLRSKLDTRGVHLILALIRLLILFHRGVGLNNGTKFCLNQK